MGAVNFSLDEHLVDALNSVLSLKVFIETGTFQGDSIANLQNKFLELHSIELSPEYYQKAVIRFADIPHIHLYQGDSAEVLGELKSPLNQGDALYFLDAHWCVATNTAGERSQCPLLKELGAIGRLGGRSVIIIDDARLFLSTPPAPHETLHWPDLQEVITNLSLLSNEHELMVVNDVIIFYPKIAKLAMKNYAHTYGIDWLRAVQSITWARAAEEKEVIIQELLDELSAKDECIQEQNRTIKAYQLAYGLVHLIGPIKHLIRRGYKIIKPRIGNLNQYAPRPLTLEKKSAEEVNPDCPLISIVTPSYYQGEFIERTMLSIFNQNYPQLEYHIQDGGSHDGTINVLQRHKASLSSWDSRKDSGQSQALNLAFAKTKGEIMGWLNSDDLLLPGTLHLVAKYFDQHSNVDVVYGNRLMIDENDMEIGRWILPGHDSNVLSWADYIPQETLFWRRSIWDRVGGRIDETYRFAMDWDLLVRFREAGAQFAHIPHFMGAFRIHGQQKTSTVINNVGYQEMDRIRERIHGRIPSPKEVHRSLLPYLIRHLIVDFGYRIRIRLLKLCR